jgi:uncharacterized protein YndB with AHSA1/START domain
MTRTKNPQVRVTRRFEASAERVFDAWLDPRLAAKWLFKSTEGEDVSVEIDARVGGRWSIVAHRAEGDMRHSGEYLAIERPTRLVFTFAVLQLSPEYDLVTVTIRPLGKGCELTLLNEMKPDIFAEWGEKTREGWTQILDGLAGAVGG